MQFSLAAATKIDFSANTLYRFTSEIDVLSHVVACNSFTTWLSLLPLGLGGWGEEF